MNKTISILISISFLITTSCKNNQYIILDDYKPMVVGKQLVYSYTENQLSNTENNIKKDWASRNDVQAIRIKITNSSETPIHGSMLRFYSNGEKLEIIDNELATKKLYTKQFPTYVYLIPVILVGVVIYAAVTTALEDDDDYMYDDGFDDEHDLSVFNRIEKKDKGKGMNIIQRELHNFNIAEKIINPGEAISGMIAFRSERLIEKLEIEVLDVDYNVVKTNFISSVFE